MKKKIPAPMKYTGARLPGQASRSCTAYVPTGTRRSVRPDPGTTSSRACCTARLSHTTRSPTRQWCVYTFVRRVQLGPQLREECFAGGLVEPDDCIGLHLADEQHRLVGARVRHEDRVRARVARPGRRWRHGIGGRPRASVSGYTWTACRPRTASTVDGRNFRAAPHGVGEVGRRSRRRDLERVERDRDERCRCEREVGVEQQRALADRAAGSVGHQRVAAAVATLVEQRPEHRREPLLTHGRRDRKRGRRAGGTRRARPAARPRRRA